MNSNLGKVYYNSSNDVICKLYDLRHRGKNTENSLILKTKTLNHLSNHYFRSQWIQVFTDGSLEGEVTF